MKDTARVRVLRAIAELAGGALCLIALVATFLFPRRGFSGIGLFILGFIGLTADGIVSLVRARRITKFR
jgi:hypothetical protein